MKILQINKQRGITLISLVLTIIVLIILAGVAINLSFGKNGLFSKAKYAKEKYTNEEYLEQEQLNEINAYLAKDGSLPENTKENPQEAGTEVKMPEEWYTVSPAYVSTEDGGIIKKQAKVATVTAVATGDGETVPVPVGFYYVGGNKDTGVIISDKKEDKYDGKTDKTTYEYTTSLQGNQFVWIPCEEKDYKKCDTWNGIEQKKGTLANSEWDTTTPEAELIQIEKYGGFYVGRYEAGLASDIKETKQNQKNLDKVYNVPGIPQSKAGIIPWIFIDWTNAKANAKSMYNNDKYKKYVSSGLITGTQWDVILNTLINKTDLTSADVTNSNSWGNYKNNAILYTGRLAKVDYNSIISNAWGVKPFEEKNTGTTTKYNGENGDLLTTGASSIAQKYHIFDLAGNVFEWTEENTNFSTSGQYRETRGGYCIGDSETYPVCHRSAEDVDYTGLAVGFRVVLYIK